MLMIRFHNVLKGAANTAAQSETPEKAEFGPFESVTIDGVKLVADGDELAAYDAEGEVGKAGFWYAPANAEGQQGPVGWRRFDVYER
jgi:hypothetical protein